MKRSNRAILIVGILLFLSLGAYACEMNFELIDSNGNSQNIEPGELVELGREETYSLVVRFAETHRRCELAPEETEFLLNEEKWLSSSEHLPMLLLNSIEWKEITKGSYEAELCFRTDQAGKLELEILRRCERKAGYEESLLFSVS
jgi:hypothetical protein